MNLKLKNFLSALSRSQQQRFAAKANTSVGSLRHLVTGRRKASSSAAIAIEHAAKDIAPELSVGLDLPLRGDLSGACAACEYNQTCANVEKME